jgi:hypothetical protein
MNPQAPSPYSNHEEIWLLLPWYANGSLDGTEADMVKNHLGVCLTCRKEFAVQQELLKTLKRAPLAGISPRDSFERLISRIEQEAASGQAPVGGRKPRAAAGWMAALQQFMTSRRLAVAVASGVLVLTLPFLPRGTPVATAPSYHTVANAGSLAQYATNDVRVVFADHVTEREIAGLLNSVHGHIVDGPTDLGVYTVRITAIDPSENAVLRSLERLRENQAVILAEPAIPQTAQQDKEGG